MRMCSRRVVKRHRFCHLHHRPLRGAVSHRRQSTHHPPIRGIVDDHTAALGAHHRQHQFAHPPDAGHIEQQRFIPVLFRDLFRGAAGDYAGIVEQNIDPPKSCLCFLNGARAVL